MARSALITLAATLVASHAALAAAHHRARPHGPSHEASRHAPALTAGSIDAAAFTASGAPDPALIVKAEILLDRDHISPGQIDGDNGDNFRKAISAFDEVHNLPAAGNLDQDTWNALAATAPGKVLTSYTISKADVTGPFTRRIPPSLKQMARLRGLSYQTPREELAEKFHMSEALLVKLNPRARFDRAGTAIVVANVEPMALRESRHTVEAARAAPGTSDPAAGAVATIVVDKPARDVRAYDKNGKLLAFYPATIGSKEKPAPTGTYRVQRVAWNPDYHYDPKFAWKGVKTRRPLTVRPGPNNPVGLVWIDLSAPSYGIHGTPDPAKIGKTASHGCVRLTNWDAVRLARMVRRGTVVKFENQDTPVAPAAGGQASDRPAEGAR